MDTLKYKDYEGTIAIDIERMVCWGKILFIDDLVTYESDSPAGIQASFQEAVEDYLETCALIRKKPEKSLRGVFNVRVTPAKHKDAIRKAVQMDTTLNDVISQALDLYLYGKQTTVQHVTNNYIVPESRTLHLAAGSEKPSWGNTDFALMASGGN